MLRWVAVLVALVFVACGGDSPPRVHVGHDQFPGAGSLIGDQALLEQAAKAWQNDADGLKLNPGFDAMWAGPRGHDRYVVLDNGTHTATVVVHDHGARVVNVADISKGLPDVRRMSDGLLIRPSGSGEFDVLSRGPEGRFQRETVRPVDDVIHVSENGDAVVLLGRLTGDVAPLYVLPGTAPGVKYLVRDDDYDALQAALTDNQAGPLALSALARLVTTDKHNDPEHLASLIHRGGDGVAVMVRGVDLAGIVFAKDKAAVGSTDVDVIGAATPGQDQPEEALGAAYVQGDSGMSLVVAGDPRIRRLVIETGKRTLRESGSFARIPAREFEGDGDRPAVSVRGYLPDGTVVPAGVPAT